MSRPISVMIAGAQKAGTTSLHEVLASHPDVHSHPQQEFGFFVDDKLFEGGFAREFIRAFGNEQVRPEQTVLAKSVGVMFLPIAAQRLADHNPSCRIIVSLRNPFERAISAFRYQLQVGREHPGTSFAQTLEREQKNLSLETMGDLHHVAYISRGLYSEQVRRLFDLFGRDSVKVVKFEELDNSDDLYSELQRFCGLELHDLSGNHQANQTGSAVSPAISRLARSKLIRVATARVRPEWRTNAYARSLALSARIRHVELPHPTMDEFSTWSIEAIHEDLELLEELTHQSFSDWRHIN